MKKAVRLKLKVRTIRMDTFMPLTHNAYIAAKRSVDCALTAAQNVLEGSRLSNALVRPPGHHAERRIFGSFCYFSFTAIAAQYLSNYGKVTILDIDYHHGNGEQDMFYERSDVLTISTHGHPRFAFPYFSGFADEAGAGAGKGYNINVPLPENVDGKHIPDVIAPTHLIDPVEGYLKRLAEAYIQQAEKFHKEKEVSN
jgi:acetoin utilization deacetylase AcuC-like enzyme